MDRRYNADNQWFVSPILTLREYLETAYETQKRAYHDVFKRPLGVYPKEENAHHTQMQEDFAALVGCSASTSKHLFEDALKLENFVEKGLPKRKWEDDMEEDVIDPKTQLLTLQRVNERIEDQDTYWKKNDFARKCKYYRFAQFDFKLNRTFNEWNDPCDKDVILMVSVMSPHNKMLTQEELNNGTKIIAPQVKFLIRGDMELQTLKRKIVCSVLYQKIRSFWTCVSDMVVDLEEGREYEPPDMEASHAVRFPSAFIFIHDTFYVDLSLPNQTDITIPIREFMSRKQIFDPVKVEAMSGVKIIDLKMRLGQPYLYLHSGTCEHLLVFHDLSLLTKSDEQDLSKYPLLSYERMGDQRCAACKTNFATFQVQDCERLPQPVMLFCESCFKDFHFFHGKKLGTFKAYPFFQMNRLNTFE